VRAPATRVLIVDDDPLIRTLLVSALRKDCLVAVATDGEEGFAKALDLKPDVAVIDINMPGWDGLKTLEAFRTHAALRAVKVIMLTGDASKQTVMAAVRAGANDYLIKTSFSKSEFYRKLNHLVPGTIRETSATSESRDVDFNQWAATVSGDAATFAAGAGPASSSQSGATRATAARPTESALSDESHSDAAHDAQLQVIIDGWD
jgi:DNA-binding response OmpR family regulator